MFQGNENIPKEMTMTVYFLERLTCSYRNFSLGLKRFLHYGYLFSANDLCFYNFYCPSLFIKLSYFITV